MSELEDRINSILSDEGQMEQISRLASRLMGGGEVENAGKGGEGGAVPDLSGLMRSLGEDGGKSALLEGLAPYISEKRAQKLRKAMRFARIAKIAGRAFSEQGDSNAV